MTDLDLDAEQRWRIGQPDRPTAIALIQRLREAEVRAERNAKAFHGQTERLREAEKFRAECERQLQEKVNEIIVQDDRIAQLERVREAAQRWVDDPDSSEGFADTELALAAVEEPPRKSLV